MTWNIPVSPEYGNQAFVLVHDCPADYVDTTTTWSLVPIGVIAQVYSERSSEPVDERADICAISQSYAGQKTVDELLVGVGVTYPQPYKWSPSTKSYPRIIDLAGAQVTAANIEDYLKGDFRLETGAYVLGNLELLHRNFPKEA